MLNIPVTNLDSKEELYFYQWLEELRLKGLCRYTYQPRTFLLFTGSKYKMKFKKGSIIPRDVNYTPDFSILWDEKLRNIIFSVPGTADIKTEFVAVQKGDQYVSVVDVKGGFSGGRNNSSAITFPLKQKWMLQIYNLYVQKIIPITNKKVKKVATANGVFVETFTPAAHLLTPTGKPRKFNYEPKMINKYLEENGIN